MAWTNIHWVPLAAFILCPVTFITTFILSVSNGNISPEFPYISDTGTSVPESCIFAQLLNIVVVLYLFTTYLRYKQIYHYYRDYHVQNLRLLMVVNKLSFLVGIISCLGMSVVANFQETNILRVHMMGALTCFAAGVVYAWLQTWITFKSYPHLNSKFICYLRFVLCVIMLTTFNLCFWLGPEAMKHFTGENPRKWHKNDGGYYLHLIASLSEWITFICLDIYIGSFTFDLKRLVMTSPSVVFISDDISIRSIKIASS